MKNAHTIRIALRPDGPVLESPSGRLLSRTLEDAGVAMPWPCGKRGLCGRCRVLFEESAPPPSEDEKRLLSTEALKAGERLACRCRPAADASVRLLETRDLHVERILDAGVTSEIVVAPEVRRRRVRLPESTLEHPVADWTRLRRALAAEFGTDSLSACLSVLRDLPSVVARAEDAGDSLVEATLDGARVIDVRNAAGAGPALGVAADLGTTTIAVSLVDMETGTVLAKAGRLNPQRRFGYDLISRVHAVQTHPSNLGTLQTEAVGAIGELIEQLCESVGASASSVVAMTLAGNTLMTHLFLGVDPTTLGRAPFAGVLHEGVRVQARELGLPVHSRAQVYVMPCIGGFVGGDVVSGILVTKLRRQPGVSVLIDVGTNGEVVVAKDGRLLATSSAAGPAFEGGKISCGMTAAEGAVHHVLLEGEDLAFRTIGGGPARGVCGSALIELFARCLETGLLAMNGRIASPSETGDLGPKLAARLSRNGDGPRIVLVPPTEGAREIVLTQADVREFQLGKGAVAAAVRMVLDEAHVRLDEVDRFLIAGAFGNHLNVADAMAVGLLPDAPPERVFFIGNSSLEGARCVLLNRYERLRAEQIAEETLTVDLASRPEFQERFALAMMLGPAMDV